MRQPRRNEFLDLVTDLMAVLGTVSARAMFGGHGLYCDGLFFAIITGDKLYFKADAQTQAMFEAHGLRRFTYNVRGKTVQLMYYEAPAEVFDEPPVMRHWAQLAIQAAVQARRPKKPA